jgi:hypothetical protein
LAVYERSFFPPAPPYAEGPFCWTAVAEFEVSKLRDGGLRACPRDEAPGLIYAVPWLLHTTGVLTLWCPHNGYFPDEPDWLESRSRKCPGRSCLLDSIVLSRVDFTVDCAVADPNEYADLLMAHPQRRLVAKDREGHGAWAFSGPAGWYAACYDRHHRTHGKVPEGTLRPEVGVRTKKLRHYGIKTPLDLLSPETSELYLHGLSWGGLFCWHGGEASAEARLAAYEVSETRRTRLSKHLAGARPMSAVTARAYRTLAAEVHLVVGLPDGGAGGPLRRLSPRRGGELVLDVDWGRRGPTYLIPVD